MPNLRVPVNIPPLSFSTSMTVAYPIVVGDFVKGEGIKMLIATRRSTGARLLLF